MSFKTNTNIKPFYDDFSEKNDYYRILFRAGNAVQARELTQLQTIIQNQIKQFGDNLYKNGSKLQGGDIYLSDERWIKTDSEESIRQEEKITPGKILTDADNNIKATVLFRFESEDGIYLFVKYDNENRFAEGIGVGYNDSKNERKVLTFKNEGIGSFAAISEGYYYVRGTAARVEDSVILISADEQKTFEKFDAETEHSPLSISIGFNILEKIYTEEDDENLYDNSAGFLNKVSKGAARLKLELELTKKELDEIDDNYVEIIKFDAGVKEVENDRTIFNEINTQIAKRTFETSGNFLNDQFIVTAGNIYNDENDNNKRKIKLNVDAGDGYVSGYRVETFGSKEFSVDAPEKTDDREVNIRQYIGNYFKVKNLKGLPTTNEVISFQNNDDDVIAKAYYRYVREVGSGENSYFEVYLYNIKTVERITIPSLSVAVEAGDVVIGKDSKARGIINNDAVTNVTTLDITDIKGSFNDTESITIIRATGGVRNDTTISNITRRNLSDARKITNGDDSLSADVILEDSHNLSGRYAITRTLSINDANRDAEIYGGGTLFLTELKIGDVIFMTAPKHSTETGNVDIVYKAVVEGITKDNRFTIKNLKRLEDGVDVNFDFSDSSNNAIFNNIELTSITVKKSFLHEPSQTPLLANLPNNRINKVVGVNYKNTKILTCTIDGTTTPDTIELSSNIDNSFTGAETSAVIFGTAGSTRIEISPVKGEVTKAEATIPDEYLGSTKIQLTFPEKTAANLSTDTKKSLNIGHSVIDGDTTNKPYGKNYADREFLLDDKDILEITGIYDYEDSSAYKESGIPVESLYSTPNKKDLFSLDTGQRDGFITFGILERKINIQAPTKPLIVFYKHYTQSGSVNFAAVDSYLTNTAGTGINTDYNKIPFYKNTPLTDSLDFRLIPSDNATLNSTALTFGNTGCPPPDSAVSANISYYLPRVDSFFVSKDGIIKINKGKSSLNPSPPPNENKNEIKIADVFLTPYVFNKEEISIKRYEYPNYTKNDIKKLENRIDNLEEFVTLSLLEKDAAAFKVTDNLGFERTKTGLVVENFSTRNRTFLGDMAHPSYKCATGENILKCRERRIPLDLLLDETKLSSGNMTLHEADGILSLEYDEISFINQPLSSFSMSVNPFNVSIYKGKVDLNLARDNWVETRQAASISTGQSRFVQENTENFIPERNNLTEALRDGDPLRLRLNLPEGQVVLTRIFRDGTGWRGQKSDGTWVERFTTAQLGRAFLEKYGSTRSLSDAQITSWLDNEVAGGEVIGQRTVRRSSRSGRTITTRTIRETTVRRIDANINEENTDVVGREVFDRRQTRSEIPLIRSRALNFNANGLKPNTRFYPFFDNDDISEHCIPTTKGYKISTVSDYDAAKQEYVITLEKPAPFGTVKNGVGQKIFITDFDEYNKEFTYTEKISGTQYRVSSSSSDSSLASGFTMIWNPKRGEDIFSDNMGDVSGQFVIPTAKYRTENRVLSLSEDPAQPSPSSHKISSASNIYVARGTLVTNTDLTQNIVRPTIRLSQNNSVQPQQIGTTSTSTFAREEFDRRSGLRFGADPVAQTFYIDATLLTSSTNKIGAYISSVEVFFSKREEVLNDAVILELVTVENGYPSQNVIASVQSPPKDENAEFVKLSDDATIPTKFTFDSPVFLQNGEEYAVVIKSNSNNYHVFVSNIGDKDVTTGKLIAGQPHLGSFFTSQNASTWNADQNKDLKFRINRCKFHIENPAGFDMLFPPLPLYDGAVLEYRGHKDNDDNPTKNIFLLRANNHGFDDDDAIKNKSIEFFYPEEADNDLGSGVDLGSLVSGSTGDYSGSFEIEDIIDKNKLLVSLPIGDIIGTLSKGTLSPISIENRLRFNEGQFNIDNTIPPGTEAATETTSFIRTDNETTNTITIGENKIFNVENIIDDDSNNTPREKIVTSISSNDDFLSPMFSTNSATFIIMKNLIDNYKEKARVFVPELAGVDNDSISKLAGIDDFVPSTDGKNDSNDAVYVTKKLLLEESSNSLKILFDSVEEEGADIKVFYKTQESDSGDFDDISWTLLNTKEYNELNPKRVSSSSDEFIEREFEVDTPNNFSAYALKFVMTTDNKPPIIKRLRIIAIAD